MKTRGGGERVAGTTHRPDQPLGQATPPDVATTPLGPGEATASLAPSSLPGTGG